MVDNYLYEVMRQRMRNVPDGFFRYIYHELPDEARMLGLTGPRGVGKSTLLFQKINGREST